jgi:hypothetical protein
VGRGLALEEIEAFCWGLKECPKCGSSEGFWLVAKLNRSYVQCKHCGDILEFCEFFPVAKKSGFSKRLFRSRGV